MNAERTRDRTRQASKYDYVKVRLRSIPATCKSTARPLMVHRIHALLFIACRQPALPALSEAGGCILPPLLMHWLVRCYLS